MPKCLSHHAFIRVKMYVVNHIIWTWSIVDVMFTCCFISCQCLRNVWWCVTHKHPSKPCSACLSRNIVLIACYATHVWKYIMLSCGKMHDPYKFEEAFSYEKVFHANESAESYIYITYMDEKDRSVDLISLFHISNGLATFFIFR